MYMKIKTDDVYLLIFRKEIRFLRDFICALLHALSSRNDVLMFRDAVLCRTKQKRNGGASEFSASRPRETQHSKLIRLGNDAIITVTGNKTTTLNVVLTSTSSNPPALSPPTKNECPLMTNIILIYRHIAL